MNNSGCQKTCSGSVLRLKEFFLSIGRIDGVECAQAKCGVAPKTCGTPEHGGNVLRLFAHSKSLLLEHNTAPLEGAGFAQAGRTEEKTPLRGPCVGPFRRPLPAPVKEIPGSATPAPRLRHALSVGRPVFVSHSPSDRAGRCQPAQMARDVSATVPAPAARIAAGEPIPNLNAKGVSP